MADSRSPIPPPLNSEPITTPAQIHALRKMAAAGLALVHAIIVPAPHNHGRHICHLCGFLQRPDAADNHNNNCPCCEVLDWDLALKDAVLDAPSDSASLADKAGNPDPGATGENFFEPWTVVGAEATDATGIVVYDATVSDVRELAEPLYARRVAACVNLCRGLPTDDIELAQEEQIAAGNSRWVLALIPLCGDSVLTPSGLSHLEAISEGGAA